MCTPSSGLFAALGRTRGQCFWYGPRVAGIIAIIADDRRTPVAVAETRALADAYAALRGSGSERVVAAGDWAQAMLLDGEVSGELFQEGPSWMVSVGALQASAPLRTPFAELDGQFAAIRYDAERDELTVLSDPFGMQAVYVARHSGKTYVSTSAMALARHLGATSNPLGRRFYLRTGFLFGPLTHWHGIERLDPGTALTFDPLSRRSDTYWRPVVDESVRKMSFDETVDHCIAVAEAALQRHIGSGTSFWADLTGGFDSRMVTTLLSHVGLSFDATTSGEEGDLDVELAREVAQTARLPWRPFRVPSTWAPDEGALHHAAAWCDGSLDVLHLADVLWSQRERSATHVTLVSGGGGEHFSGYPWLPEYLWAPRSRRIHPMFAVMNWVPRIEMSFMRDSGREEVESYARQRFVERAALFSGESATTQYDAVYAYKSTGHFGAYRSANEAYIRQTVPCYYRDIFTAALSADYRWRNGHRLHRAIITRLNPSVAAVAVTRGGNALPVNALSIHRLLPYYTKFARAAARRVRHRLAPASTPHAAAQAPRAYAAAVGHLRAVGILDPRRMHTGDDYRHEALDALVQAACQGQAPALKLVGRVATAELAVRDAAG